MDAAGRVARRLERIEALERERVSSSELLGELRALVREAEALARGEASLRRSETWERGRQE